MLLLLGFVLLCLGWVAPGHYFPWVSFQQEWIAAVGVALIGLSALTAADGRRVPSPWLAVFALAVAGIPIAQLLWGQVRFVSDGTLASAYVAAFALSLVAGANLVRHRRSDFLNGLYAVLLVASVASVGMALTQWLQLGPIGYIADAAPGAQPYANLAQPNHLVTLLALGVVAALHWYESRRIGGTVTALVIVWLGVGIVMTRSRTGWLFVLLLILGWGLLRRRTTLRTSLAAIVVGVAAFVAVTVAWEPLSEKLLVSSLTLAQRLEAGPRTLLWHSLLDALWSSPWVGYGWTQVGLATQAASLQHITGRGMLNNSHDIVLDLLLWNGIPIGLLIVAALFGWFWLRIRRCCDAEQGLLLLGVATVGVHALLEYPLEYAYFLLPTGLMMGALDGLDGESVAWHVPRGMAASLLFVLSGMLGWIGVEYMRVEESARQMRLVMAGIGVDKVSTVPPPEVLLLDGPREFHRYWLTHARAGMSQADLDWMRRVMERQPVPPAQLRYALAAGLNGRPKEAEDTLTRLCYMHRAERCKEGYGAWSALQKQYPQLRATAFPAKGMQVIAQLK